MIIFLYLQKLASYIAVSWIGKRCKKPLYLLKSFKTFQEKKRTPQNNNISLSILSFIYFYCLVPIKIGNDSKK